MVSCLKPVLRSLLELCGGYVLSMIPRLLSNQEMYCVIESSYKTYIGDSGHPPEQSPPA